MSVELLELAARALEPLLGEVVFLGGASVTLWITDPGAPSPRPTKDIDIVVEVTTRAAFRVFEGQLRSLGFAEDLDDGVICRWRHTVSGLILDAMLRTLRSLGSTIAGRAPSIPHAIERALPSGAKIRAAPPTYLLATKLEAFKGRGDGDFLGSSDFADLIALVDGREELIDEVRQGDSNLRAYLAAELADLAALPQFRDGVSAALRPDAASQARGDLMVVPRLRTMSEAAVAGARTDPR